MTAILVPQLVAAVALAGVIAYTTRRAITESDALAARAKAEMFAATDRAMAEMRATATVSEPVVRLTLTLRPRADGADGAAVAAAVRSAVEAGLREHLDPTIAVRVELTPAGT